MRNLVVIPARKGSKGIPGKNLAILGSKPLIQFSIEFACQIAKAEDICVTSDDDEIIELAKQNGVPPLFKRPPELSTDEAGSFEVLKHALDYYDQLGNHYELVTLLQPTSPFRLKQHFDEMRQNYHPDLDMLCSVRISHDNPYWNLYERDENDWLQASKEHKSTRRQSLPKVFAQNGSIYLINARSLRNAISFANLKRIKGYEMSDYFSIDIDSPLDFALAQLILEQNLIQLP